MNNSTFMDLFSLLPSVSAHKTPKHLGGIQAQALLGFSQHILDLILFCSVLGRDMEPHSSWCAGTKLQSGKADTYVTSQEWSFAHSLFAGSEFGYFSQNNPQEKKRRYCKLCCRMCWVVARRDWYISFNPTCKIIAGGWVSDCPECVHRTWETDDGNKLYQLLHAARWRNHWEPFMWPGEKKEDGHGV